jgi:hypothetical protein
MIAKITGKLRMMKKYILQSLILPLLLTSCGTFLPPPTAIDVDGIRTQAAGTAIAALTQQAIQAIATPIPTPTPTLRVMPDLCKPPAVHESPNFDRSDQGYFMGVLVISEYYTLLDNGLQEEAYKMLSLEAQKATPRSQYVEAQKKNLKSVQIITIEPLRVWKEQQGIEYRVMDLVNRINFYVQIRVSAEENTPTSAQTGELQTLYLTLVLTEPEHAWKIDTFATELVPAPDYAGSVPYAALFSGADQSYYDALVAIGRHYTFFNHGFYEQSYRLVSSSSPHLGSLEEYVAGIQLLKIKVNRVVKITPLYAPQWKLPCLTPGPVNGRIFYAYIYAEGESGWAGSVPNGIHSSYINMVLEDGEWKMYSVNSGQ